MGVSGCWLVAGVTWSVGIESTVLDLTVRPPMILRPGAVSQREIEELIGPVGAFTGVVDASMAAASPGQQGVHYSPRAAAYRVEAVNLERVRGKKNTVVVSIEPEIGDVQMPSDPAEYARVLYARLREVDRDGVAAIFIQMPPAGPEWVAVRDRLMRATQALPIDLESILPCDDDA